MAQWPWWSYKQSQQLRRIENDHPYSLQKIRTQKKGPIESNSLGPFFIRRVKPLYPFPARECWSGLGFGWVFLVGWSF